MVARHPLQQFRKRAEVRRISRRRHLDRVSRKGLQTHRRFRNAGCSDRWRRKRWIRHEQMVRERPAERVRVWTEEQQMVNDGTMWRLGTMRKVRGVTVIVHCK